MKSNEIRAKFLNFFQSKEHKIVPSAPLVLKDDPTLMFSNSGMTQFKDYFLGYQTPVSNRIADTQKCLRVSGKHNDLDDVGKDTYHHTMFEMLGNWSFGDYFKKEAIEWSWELLTKEFGISKDNIYVTIFEGDASENLERDQEAYDFWKEHISEDRILNGNKNDNFWEMGEQGPCGPCSEIHVDIRSAEEKAQVDGKSLVNMDHPQVIEIWNLVFMEFNRKANGSLEKLPQQHVDTGMGFERLCMVLQGKTSNYDTDVFTDLIAELESISNKKYGSSQPIDMAIRVVVDHVRAVAFAIADGQLPSNNGAGYVIRRILRRAISYGYRNLGMNEPFIHKLIPVLAKQMGEAFPELPKQQKLINDVIFEEERSFLRTIEQGLVRLDNLISNSEGKVLSGAAVFELYDTFGFPPDLSRIIAEEKGFSIDEKGYEEEMAKQKKRSQKASATATSDWVVVDANASESFVGYDRTDGEVNITRYRKVENNKGEFYQIVLDQTPFYAESGGQIGDSGFLIAGDEKVEVLDTKKENNLIIHITKDLPEVKEGLTAKVNVKRRNDIMKNHSATHLLHQALRTVLGEHVQQKGSFVGPDYLRFDFSHFSKLTEEELKHVNDFVNNKIKEHLDLIEDRAMAFNDAIDAGAIALFGEKYGDVVRMIKFGDSVELCGGTHVVNTSDIYLFQIVSESSSAAGIRRIEAITGDKALAYFKNFEQQFRQVEDKLGKPKDVLASLEKLQYENDALKKEIENYKLQEVKNQKQVWKNQAQTYGDVNAILIKTSMDNALIKDIVFQLKAEIDNLFIVVANSFKDKPTISVGMSDNVVKEKSWNAGNLVREWAKEIKGGGGGQPDFATAGGKDVNGLSKVLELAKELLD
ncbi:alanine--tRNA ligase [Weeksellaceae bacterium KMM 9713]|uniref:Alanine--tRNA ligase n=1 Tax=Profundicola chukchiensis TaxID=2961959 RepID=A0A9X4RUS1_9FLAO|nr:alanine--tRNA ligase [Profundicola chukchiensis]MDG4945961.1 alanine--tRNA ligase [Profundicola chukchiensis]